MTPQEEILSQTLATVDSQHVRQAWQKAMDRRETDPDGAITIARSLIESVCKHILGPGGYSTGSDLAKLFKEAAALLRLTEDAYADESLKGMLRGSTQVIHNLAEFRNKMSDAHGHGPTEPIATQLQAEFAVTLAGATATFLIETWESKRKVDHQQS